MKHNNPSAAAAIPSRPTGWAAFGALGVVFGDLGTSPLYTLQTVVQATGGQFTPQSALGVLSLIVLDLDHHGFDQVLPVRHARRQSRRRRHPRVDVAHRRKRLHAGHSGC